MIIYIFYRHYHPRKSEYYDIQRLLHHLQKIPSMRIYSMYRILYLHFTCTII